MQVVDDKFRGWRGKAGQGLALKRLIIVIETGCRPKYGDVFRGALSQQGPIESGDSLERFATIRALVLKEFIATHIEAVKPCGRLQGSAYVQMAQTFCAPRGIDAFDKALLDLRGETQPVWRGFKTKLPGSDIIGNLIAASLQAHSAGKSLGASADEQDEKGQ